MIPAAGINSFGAIQKFIAKAFSSDESTREKAQISVINGSNLNGIASTEKDNLEKSGLTVKNVGNTKMKFEEKYYVYDLTEKNPATRKNLEERYKIKVSDKQKLPEDIDRNGVDFVIILGDG